MRSGSFVQSISDALGHLHGISHSANVHEHDPGLFIEEMVVQSGHLDVCLLQERRLRD